MDNLPRIDERRTDKLKRGRRAPALGYVHPLEKTAPRIDPSRLQGRHVGRGRHPGQSGFSVPHPPFPSFHPYDGQRNIQPLLFLIEQGQLAGRQSVADRNRQHADKRSVRRIEQRPLDAIAPQRVRPVQDDHIDIPARCHLHEKGHGVHVRVVASPHILHIANHQVDIVQESAVGNQGVLILSVQTNHLDVDLRLPLHGHLILLRGEQSVFGGEHPLNRQTFCPQHIPAVPQITRHRGLIRQQGDTSVPVAMHRIDENIQSCSDHESTFIP